jgi:curved DNA-binding protein CbpA
LLYEEALDVLALDHDATATEIKEAYRDLVKVWHPDRFGSDPRLRRKAEEKLQQINDAYRLLQSPLRPDSKPVEAEPYRYTGSSAVSNKVHGRPSKEVVGWICGGLAIAVVLVVAAVALRHGSPPTETRAIPPPQAQESTGGGSSVKSSPRKEPSVPLHDANHSNHAASARFRVHPLSDAEAAQLESACPREKKMQDPTAYQDCVRAQLDTSEPDLSALSRDDRAGIESACRKTKSRGGSSAYNRCLRRTIKLLKDSIRP